MELFSYPHRRFNPLLKSWILVSPQRINRPWDGKVENLKPKNIEVDNTNPLLPNAIRSSGERNPNYESIFLFENDFPALIESQVENQILNESTNFNFFQIQIANGNCYVMCFNPKSDVTLATMKIDEIVEVINKWVSIISIDGSKYDWIQIFENRGEMMGCSNSHPHCQIWSTKYLPHLPSVKNINQKEYFNKYNQPMLYDYINREIETEKRIVCLNDTWACLVPFWAEWPFETMLLPRRKNVHRLNDLNDNEVRDLAVIMQSLLQKYNRLFNTEFPYSMGWHSAPTGSYLTEDPSHWTLHAIYYPPLLRSATVKKFFAGFELFAEIQRDLTPEKAAQILRNT